MKAAKRKHTAVFQVLLNLDGASPNKNTAPRLQASGAFLSRQYAASSSASVRAGRHKGSFGTCSVVRSSAFRMSSEVLVSAI